MLESHTNPHMSNEKKNCATVSSGAYGERLKYTAISDAGCARALSNSRTRRMNIVTLQSSLTLIRSTLSL